MLLFANLPFFFVLAAHGFLTSIIVYLSLKKEDPFLWRAFFFVMIVVCVSFSIESATHLKLGGGDVVGAFVIYIIEWAAVYLLVEAILRKLFLENPQEMLAD